MEEKAKKEIKDICRKERSGKEKQERKRERKEKEEEGKIVNI